MDIFDIGSDWEGIFDYLNEFTKVVYLPRTEGISSKMLRAETTTDVKVGVIGEVVDIEASLSRLLDMKGREFDPEQVGGALFEQGSYPLLPIIKLMGCNYKKLESLQPNGEWCRYSYQRCVPL